MNMIGYLCCALGFISVVSTIDGIHLRDKQNDQGLYDSLLTEDTTRPKRPFCNAFTGCGKKRSLYADSSVESQEQTTGKIAIPVAMYRALLRAANREIRHELDKVSRADNTEIDEYSDLNNKIPSRERYQS